MDREWVELLIALISGLAAAIPLVIKLVEYVRVATREKNWGVMMNLLLDFMKEAEELYENGADRKEWVLSMVNASADTINYDVDVNAIGAMIDSLCDMSKAVNTKQT
jgi:hypothetical protein